MYFCTIHGFEVCVRHISHVGRASCVPLNGWKVACAADGLGGSALPMTARKAQRPHLSNVGLFGDFILPYRDGS